MNHLMVGELTRTKRETRLQTALKEPRQYKVVLLDDDYTPMDYVVEILMRFFHFNGAMAVEIMLQIHTKGRGICGVFTKDVAETKVYLVKQDARKHGYPLMARIEPE